MFFDQETFSIFLYHPRAAVIVKWNITNEFKLSSVMRLIIEATPTTFSIALRQQQRREIFYFDAYLIPLADTN